MAQQAQLLSLDSLSSLSDSVAILVQPVGASKAYQSTVGAIRTGLARTNSPTFTGNVLLPTALTEDVSTRAASTEFVDNKARSLISQLKQIKQIQQATFSNLITFNTTGYINTGIQLAFTPTRSDSLLLIDVFLNGVGGFASTPLGVSNWLAFNLGWNGNQQITMSDVTAFLPAGQQSSGIGGVSARFLLAPNHNGLSPLSARTYQIFGKSDGGGMAGQINWGAATNGGRSGIIIQELVI